MQHTVLMRKVLYMNASNISITLVGVVAHLHLLIKVYTSSLNVRSTRHTLYRYDKYLTSYLFFIFNTYCNLVCGQCGCSVMQFSLLKK